MREEILKVTLEGLARNYNSIKDIKRKNLNDDAAKNLLDMFVNNAEQYNKYLNYYKRRKVHNEKR